MSMLFSHSSPVIKERLQGEKFRITDSLSESLIRSLSTKVFYTLAHYKLFDKFEGAIELGNDLVIYPYRSILGDIRYLIELKSLQDSPIIVHWNGKFDQKIKNKHSSFFINVKDFNVTNCLDNFVAFEQRVVAALHAIENEFFEAVPINMHRHDADDSDTPEIPVMHTHADEE